MTTLSHVAPAAGADVEAVGDSDARAAQIQRGQDVSAADRFMLRLLRIKQVDPIDIEGVKKAHRAFRWAIVFSAIRCTITYLVIPILIPIISVAGAVATPVSIGLCVAAGINGVIGVRRFWKTDHVGKWKYTWFMAFVFLILIGTLVFEFTRLVTG
ncbi:MAG: hypothetical protein L0J74_02270 [Corynebacterium sp.]|nr:hypothetical protein [Corynebacterium sp.]MDN5722082.1 hypothetical protein [Corynebacterium sp.]MDN6282301.1 hypothetical protein [Corynebacterium sp.]MDN6304624.1 hypothetical protein [Corynebacterium sp.]MDN6352929.1 hypothetical protein [Corynebacterium sp.]MDN6368107.1 hypothetical protein [Corynebacterium sp.]